MAYVQWPATLPGPKYPAGPEWDDTLLRSGSESGLARARKVRTQAVDRVKVTFVLPPPSAYLDFRAFVETNLKGGALWFQAPWLDGLGLTGLSPPVHRILPVRFQDRPGYGARQVAVPVQIVHAIATENGCIHPQQQLKLIPKQRGE